MNLALVFSALLMGLAGSWHCAVMCGATSAAVQRSCARGQAGWAPWWGFQVGRLLGYAAAGAVVASSVAALSQLGQWSPALRPLWVLAHSAALGLGLWLMWTGQQPAWLARLGRSGQAGSATLAGGAWQTVQLVGVSQRGGPALRGAVRAAAGGAVWFAWPCGLLQSALMLAALADGPGAGAGVMAGFALGSAAGLGGLQVWLLRTRLRRSGAMQGDAAPQTTQWLMRAAGIALAAGSAWALAHGVWQTLRLDCF